MSGNGRSGRRPKPTALKRAAGNPGGRPLNDLEPEPALKIPPCPRQLGSIARAEWRRISKELLALGLVTQIDRAALAAYCQTYERWLRAEQEVKEHISQPDNPGGSMLVQTKGGGMIQHPAIGIANRALEIMRAYLVEFGLTPSSRSRIRVPKKSGGSPWDQFRVARPTSRPPKLHSV